MTISQNLSTDLTEDQQKQQDIEQAARELPYLEELTLRAELAKKMFPAQLEHKRQAEIRRARKILKEAEEIT